MIEKHAIKIIIICICTCIVLFLTGYSVGYNTGVLNMKKEAIENGCGEWGTGPDSNPLFKWKK